jgi:hypothetical protein
MNVKRKASGILRRSKLTVRRVSIVSANAFASNDKLPNSRVSEPRCGDCHFERASLLVRQPLAGTLNPFAVEC